MLRAVFNQGLNRATIMARETNLCDSIQLYGELYLYYPANNFLIKILTKIKCIVNEVIIMKLMLFFLFADEFPSRNVPESF